MPSDTRTGCRHSLSLLNHIGWKSSSHQCRSYHLSLISPRTRQRWCASSRLPSADRSYATTSASPKTQNRTSRAAFPPKIRRLLIARISLVLHHPNKAPNSLAFRASTVIRANISVNAATPSRSASLQHSPAYGISPRLRWHVSNFCGVQIFFSGRLR